MRPSRNCQANLSAHCDGDVAATTAMVPIIVSPVTCSLPSRKISEMSRLNNGVVATIGATWMTMNSGGTSAAMPRYAVFALTKEALNSGPSFRIYWRLLFEPNRRKEFPCVEV